MFTVRGRRLLSLLVIMAVAAVAQPTAAAAADPDQPAAITLHRWDSAREFVRGSWDNLRLGRDQALEIRSSGRTATYTDPFGEGEARSYDVGSWTSPVVELGYAGDEAVASWNARTPTGTFVETTFRGRKLDGSWTKWYVLGRWASGNDFAGGDIHRTSVDGQNDDDAAIWTDTFSVRTGREIGAYQVRVTLYRPQGTQVSPELDALSVLSNAYLGAYDRPTSEFTLGRQVELAVPRFSQNIHRGEYPEFGGGGQVWCSPTSTSMVQYFYGNEYRVPESELAGIEAPNGDPQVPYAAINTWDYTYQGAGNWPFNAAYAHRYGLEAFVTRLRSLAEVERFIAAGIPVITSLSWELAEMPEAGYDTDGHLMVIIGFTADGDPILNDPASNSNEAVRNVYTRKNFERVWQNATDGIVYILRPPSVPLPEHVAGATPNW
ncbi:MAG TPA: C39 family peptidase [Microlunatus sp.]|nr:C39 family peptidase [Microlunatus sp.]